MVVVVRWPSSITWSVFIPLLFMGSVMSIFCVVSVSVARRQPLVTSTKCSNNGSVRFKFNVSLDDRQIDGSELFRECGVLPSFVPLIGVDIPLRSL